MFKDHPIYGKYFSVSENGEILSKRTNKLLKLRKTKSGYQIFVMSNIDDKKRVCFYVHKMVAETWIENPENKPEANHIDGIKTNNNVSNLEWVTRSENMLHAYKTGLYDVSKISGVKSKKAKLTKEQIFEILESKETALKLSEKYGVHRTTINSVRRGATYKNLGQR